MSDDNKRLHIKQATIEADYGTVVLWILRQVYDNAAGAWLPARDDKGMPYPPHKHEIAALTRSGASIADADFDARIADLEDHMAVEGWPALSAAAVGRVRLLRDQMLADEEVAANIERLRTSWGAELARQIAAEEEESARLREHEASVAAARAAEEQARIDAAVRAALAQAEGL